MYELEVLYLSEGDVCGAGHDECSVRGDMCGPHISFCWVYDRVHMALHWCSFQT